MTAVSTMTSRERWLAALRLEEVDRLPFWPKLDGKYNTHQEGRFKDMSVGAIFDWLECDPPNWGGSGVKCVRTHTRQSREELEPGVTATLYHTPYGEMRTVHRYDARSNSNHPVEFPCKTVEDIRRMTAFFEDAQYEPDPEAQEKTKAHLAETADRGVRNCGLGESPLMLWVEHLAGVENAHYMLMDYEEEVHALFEAIHQDIIRRTEMILQCSAADCFIMVENTSTTLISPEQYRQYCGRHLPVYLAMVREAGKLSQLHMCGYLKDILPDIHAVGADSYEAFTSPPVGNTTFLDGRTACPDVALVGGTNARLWMHDAETIVAELKSHLDALPHHRGIVPSSAGVMPPVANPETIKAVCDFVKSYPAKF